MSDSNSIPSRQDFAMGVFMANSVGKGATFRVWLPVSQPKGSNTTMYA